MKMRSHQLEGRKSLSVLLCKTINRRHTNLPRPFRHFFAHINNLSITLRRRRLGNEDRSICQQSVPLLSIFFSCGSVDVNARKNQLAGRVTSSLLPPDRSGSTGRGANGRAYRQDFNGQSGDEPPRPLTLNFHRIFPGRPLFMMYVRFRNGARWRNCCVIQTL
jgi:hypothetical protein